MTCLVSRRVRVAVASVVLILTTVAYEVRWSPELHAVSSSLVISQVYGGGGNSGATWTHDFIEILNIGTTAVEVDGWTVQYISAAGTGVWATTPLTGTIQPGRYYLIQEARGTGGTTELPPPDATGTIAMSATAGNVALVSSLMPLVGNPSARGDVVDRVGYGDAPPTPALWFEGSGPTNNPSNTTAALRGHAGCLDRDDNAIDFATGIPTPRNSAVDPFSCAALPLAIHDIQGNGLRSPHDGLLVWTDGVVTARKFNGFFLQLPDEETDEDAKTSEGIFVFTDQPPPAFVQVGSRVEVTAVVQEFVPPSDLNSPPVTELGLVPLVALGPTEHPVPPPIAITAAHTDPNGYIEQLERLEGMRVTVSSVQVVAPTGAFSFTTADEVNARSRTNGIFFGVIPPHPRPFREPGIEDPEPIPMPPCCIPRFGANPERLRFDSRAQPGSVPLEVASGWTVRNITGPLDFGSRTATILMDPLPPPIVEPVAPPSPIRPPAGDEFTVASFNAQRFFDNRSGPPGPVLTDEAYDMRLNKLSLAIRTRMHAPDILALEEVERLVTIEDIAARVNGDAVAAREPNPHYQGFLLEGHDVGGIDSGFLVKRSRVTVVGEQVVQEGHEELFEDGSFLHDRPPLVLQALVHPPEGSPFPVTVYAIHNRSLVGIDDPGAGRVRNKRRAQAESEARLIQQRQAANPSERIVVVGDFNGYEFSDGYVDVLGTIKGAPTAANEVERPSPDLVDPDLVLLTELVPASERYSYSFRGNAQAIDHALVSETLVSQVSGIAYSRGNADSPESYRNDPTRFERLSDHDMLVAYFTFPQTASANLSLETMARPPTSLPGGVVRFESVLGNRGPSRAVEAVFMQWLPEHTRFIRVSAPPDWSCDTPEVGESGEVTCRAESLPPQMRVRVAVLTQVRRRTPAGTTIVSPTVVWSAVPDPVLRDNFSRGVVFVGRR